MKSYAHQVETLEATKDERIFAIFWEQGTGKTKLILDNAMYLRDAGKIDALFVIAPNGVHRNWVEDEIPVWMDDNYATAFFRTGMLGTIKGKHELKNVAKHPFAIITMSYNSMMTRAAVDWARNFIKSRNVLFVADESHFLKNWSKTTQRVVAIGKWANYRRILTGTPISNAPLDYYHQFQFLDPDFWKQRGFSGKSEFSTHFGIYQTTELKEPRVAKNGRVITSFTTLVGYKSLNQLKELVNPFRSRVTKDDKLDLPPKTYSKRYFEMSKAQKDAYKDLKKMGMMMFDDGNILAAELPIVKLMRFHQITSNYLPKVNDKGEIEVVYLSSNNPRLACLEALLEEVHHGCIIWARFRHDIDLITELLGDRCVRYDGAVGNEDRAAAKEMFQSGERQFFVANPAVGATGLTLTKARTVIYYNNDFRLVNRLQSEDRAHRIGQEHPVQYIDIVCPGTVDVHITKNLVNKVEIAADMNGDTLKEWIG